MRAKEMEQLRMEHKLLSYLGKYDNPVGATTLVLVLGKEFGLSQASIGRKLMEFDTLGYTESKGRKGRLLAPPGKDRLADIERQLTQWRDQSNLLDALNVSDEESLLDMLIARRALERETAWLAASKASEQTIQELWHSIEAQDEAIADGRVPIEEDREFHERIAVASGNRVLLHALRLVWGEGAHLPATALIRKAVGSELVVDHRQIVECIAHHEPDEAASAMVTHINQLIEDVRIYFDKSKA
ncbi:MULTISPECIES: FadR/GntR family transcriptional regulator [unclassified Paenibacillus]|uniref:FadR/GntR family transcriptional regulator n=1 Tax=unclassified Paenibacillus TaxID=185978 RepID=UPI0024B89747|nr:MULTISPECIES: FCD domain-containing protein [unclassified Paenibacillus]